MNRSIIRECLAGGLTALVLVLIYNILLRAHLDGVQLGDWLQFAGAMLGTAFAVVGAVYVESWKRRRENEQGQATLLDVLNQMNDAFAEVVDPLEGDLSKDLSQIKVRRFILEVAKGFAEFALKQHISPDSRVWRNTHGYINYIDRILSVPVYVFDEAGGEEVADVDTVKAWFKSVNKIVDSVRPIIQKEIDDAHRPSPKA